MSDPLMGIYGDILNDRRKAMSHRDIYNFLPQLLAVLIDRAGGTLELSEQDVERVANMGPIELEYFQQDMFTGPFVKIRYNERVNIQGETVTEQSATRFYANEVVSVRDLLGADPDFTGGLSVDEYMNEQRGRGQE